MDTIYLLKLIMIMVTTPIWLPFMKEMWSELNLAMRPDGGIFGAPLPPKKRKEVAEAMKYEPNPLVHIPKAHLGIRQSREQAKAPVRPGPQVGGPRRRPMGR